MEKIHNALVKVATPPRKKSTLIKVVLHGRLRDFGDAFRLHAHDACQAVSGVAANCPGFAEALRRGRYRLIAGGLKRGRVIAGGDLMRPLDAATLHLVPVPQGAGRGRGKAILGLTLLGLSFIPGANAAVAGAFGSVGGSIAGAGGSAAFQQFGSHLLGRVGGLFLLGGGLELLAPQTPAPAGTLPSSAIAAPETTGQGAAIPLVYGSARLSAPVVISSGLDVETH